MGAIMFGGGGLFFILLGIFLGRRHRDFILKSVKVNGSVIDIVDKVHISRGVFGQRTGKRTIKAPVVQYKYNKLYKFQGEIDARSHGLTQGSAVEVLIDPLLPRTAKLRAGAKESTLIFKLMIGLGVFSCAIGAVQFNRNDYSLSFLYDPFTLAVVIAAIIFLYLKLWPMLRLLSYAPIYYENAVEVEKEHDLRSRV